MFSSTNKSFDRSKSHDVLEYYPSLIKVIDSKTMRILSDPKYSPLTLALMKGPMTIKELEKAYNAIAEAPKSDKTLYRYLKTLIEAELVVNAGQRVIIGKRATEILYSRTARMFFTTEEEQCEWDEAEKKVIFQLLKEVLGKERPPKKVFERVLSSFSRSREETMAKIGELTESDELGKLIEDIEWHDTTCLINDVAVLAWVFSQPDQSIQMKEFSET
ncbi:MAG: hypothetical protein ACFFB3_08735 [Candidatus Hodarchaeota archaeon]